MRGASRPVCVQERVRADGRVDRFHRPWFIGARVPADDAAPPRTAIPRDVHARVIMASMRIHIAPNDELFAERDRRAGGHRRSDIVAASAHRPPWER